MVPNHDMQQRISPSLKLSTEILPKI